MSATERLMADDAGIARAATLLRAGQVVAFPTETVYGLGADATDAAAVARIFAAKDRPQFNPLIVHVPDVSAAQALIELPQSGMMLAEAFWPGPLTMVAPMRGHQVADLVTAGLDTLGVRVPAHPVGVALLRAVGRPIAAPSANPSGRVSPTLANHVLEGLDNRISAVLDGGACPVGLESTIVGFDADMPVMLRPGGVTQEALEAVVGRIGIRQTGASISAPGQLASHYAPTARVRMDVVDDPVIGFGSVAGHVQLSETADLAEAAANLFMALRQADALVPVNGVITVAPIPDKELGVAINDRLRRAAAPR